MLIDTHAHLNFPDYDKDLDQTIGRAQKEGVKKIICVSSNIADSQKAIEISKQYPGVVYAAIGIHPQQTDPGNSASLEEQIQQLESLAANKSVVAIGECGLDFSPAPPGEKDRSRKEQVFLFLKQIEIAQKNKLALIIHTRESFSQTIETLKGSGNLPKGVVHCYSGGKKGVTKVLELGYYFGFDGNLTYDLGLQNVCRQIPLDKIILETDSPFLSPKPFRGKRNEPANTKIIAEFLGQSKNTSLAKIADTTTKNAGLLFGI